MSGPSLAELRAAGQPDSVTARRNEEHWAGRRYMRRLSPYGTWVFARLGWSPNAVTWLMIVIGVGAGAVAAVGGLATAVAAVAGLGIRAQGDYALYGGYVSIGLAAAICAILIKAETDNVIVARAKAGLPGEPAAGADAALEPAHAGLARARRLGSALRLHRIIQAVELSLLIVAAAVIDALRGGLAATRVLTVACLAVGVVMVAAHLAAVLASRRLG